MFDWVKFDLSRFTQPVVIIGLIFMILGLILVLTSNTIGKMLEEKFNKKYTVFVYSISTIILFVGVFILLFGVK